MHGVRRFEAQPRGLSVLLVCCGDILMLLRREEIIDPLLGLNVQNSDALRLRDHLRCGLLLLAAGCRVRLSRP